MTIAIALLVLILLIIIICESFLRFALKARVTEADESAFPFNTMEYQQQKEHTKAFLSSCQDVFISSWDKTELHAFFHKNLNSHKYLISIHGYHSSATENGAFYTWMAEEKGYSVLSVDVRGHGKSKGKWLSMGEWEAKDILEWIKWLEGEDKEAKIAIIGTSMGGATTMLALARSNDDPQVRVAVEDCGYSSVYEEFRHQLHSMFHLSSFPLLSLINLWCRLRLGFFFSRIRPANELERCTKPLFIIHGDADDFVPTPMGDICYRHHSGEKAIWLTKGCRHAASLTQYTDEYRQRASDFIEKYID